MNLQVRLRLSLMMFLEYFVWGAWYVTISTWLASTLHFNGSEIGLAAGATSIGAIVAPFFVGLVADRFFATQKILAVLHLLGGVLQLVVARQTHFGGLYPILLLYCLCYMPTLALTNSLAFRQMRDPQEEFGFVRVLGSCGWIVAGLLIGYLRQEATAMPMEIGGIASLVMGAYCLTLPHTPPLDSGARGMASIFPRGVLALFQKRSTLIFVIASVLICIPLQFYYAFTNLFLNQAGVVNAAGKMTVGQISEVLCMVSIPWFFRRLGVKYMLTAGMLAWVVRYLFFAYGNAGAGMWMFWGGIALHGISYDFFFVTGQIYIDAKVSTSLRAAAQGLITFLTYGIGMFIGAWFSGLVVNHYTLAAAVHGMTYDWRSVWIFASVLAAIVLVCFFVSFSEKKEDRGRIVVDGPVEAAPTPL